jgi:nitrate reductase gamma subunit
MWGTQKEGSMAIFLALLTYFAYVFVVVMYTVKAITYARMPIHLRWELYPLPQYKSFIIRFIFVLKDNFYLGEYFHEKRGYWLVLFPWHMGFILIITLHILSFFGAFAMLRGLSISAETVNIVGRGFYYVILVIGVCSFTAGSFGSIGLLIKRISDRELKAYSAPVNYFNYFFTMIVFLSGLYAWYFVDPTFSAYRVFWKGLLTLSPKDVEPATAIHIFLFALFLIYLPFTRSMHYITRFFAYFWILWDEAPNVKGSKIEQKVIKLLNQPVSWSAPHIQSNKRWSEVASEVKFPENRGEN